MNLCVIRRLNEFHWIRPYPRRSFVFHDDREKQGRVRYIYPARWKLNELQTGTPAI